MKTYISKIALLSAVTLLSYSCETKFSLDDLGGEPKIFIQSFPADSQNVFYVQVARTRPVGKPAGAVTGSFVPNVKIGVNGETLPVKSASGNLWYVEKALKEGDRIDISVRAEGLDYASASTVIPDAFPEFTVKANSSEGRYLNVCVSFDDPAETEDYYGIQLVRETVVRDSSGDIVGCSRLVMTPDRGMDIGGRQVSGRDYIDANLGAFVPDYETGTVRCWSDVAFNGRRAELTLRTWLSRDYYNEGETVSLRYYVLAHKLSKEYFAYARMIYHMNENYFAMLGLAPSSFAYTNVEGGLGAVAGFSVSESDCVYEEIIGID